MSCWLKGALSLNVMRLGGLWLGVMQGNALAAGRGIGRPVSSRIAVQAIPLLRLIGLQLPLAAQAH